MTILRPLLVVGLVLTLAASTANAAKGDKAKKKKKAQVASVTAVNSESITVKLGAKKKKGQPAPEAKEEKFKIDDKTTVEKVAGKKGEKTTTVAKVTDIKTGERVIVQGEGGVAKKIEIIEGKKKKKKNA